jgi:hypothetical protein
MDKLYTVLHQVVIGVLPVEDLYIIQNVNSEYKKLINKHISRHKLEKNSHCVILI